MSNYNHDYDYSTAIRDDIRQYIEDKIERADWIDQPHELEDHLNNTLWIEDSITGNASGSYWFSRYRAECALAHNWDLLRECLAELGADMPTDPETADVIIRCALLSGCIADVLAELEQGGYFDVEEVSA